MKRYKVTGEQPVLDDRKPGDVFEATLDPGVENFLLTIGAIKITSTDPEHDQRLATNQPKETKKASGKKKG
jgi:hypothetical protein